MFVSFASMTKMMATAVVMWPPLQILVLFQESGSSFSNCECNLNVLPCK